MENSITKNSNINSTIVTAKSVKPAYYKDKAKSKEKTFILPYITTMGQLKELECTPEVYKKVTINKYNMEFFLQFQLEIDEDTNKVIGITSIANEEGRRHFSTVDPSSTGETNQHNIIIIQVHDNDAVSVKYRPNGVSQEILQEITSLINDSEKIQVHDFLGDKYMVKDIRTSNTSRYIHVDPTVS